MNLVNSCVFLSVITFFITLMENTESKNTFLAPQTLESEFRVRDGKKPGRQTKGDGTESISLGSIFQCNYFLAQFSKELELCNCSSCLSSCLLPCTAKSPEAGRLFLTKEVEVSKRFNSYKNNKMPVAG